MFTYNALDSSITVYQDGVETTYTDFSTYAAAFPDRPGDAWVFAPYIAPDLTPQQERAQARDVRARAIAAITVDVGGKVFDGDETSQTRMARAILGMQIAGAETITWTLADNTVVPVTLAELGQALVLAGGRQAELWPIV